MNCVLIHLAVRAGHVPLRDAHAFLNFLLEMRGEPKRRDVGPVGNRYYRAASRWAKSGEELWEEMFSQMASTNDEDEWEKRMEMLDELTETSANLFIYSKYREDIVSTYKEAWLRSAETAEESLSRLWADRNEKKDTGF